MLLNMPVALSCLCQINTILLARVLEHTTVLCNTQSKGRDEPLCEHISMDVSSLVTD
jgi:hypothetical protein